MKVYGDLQSGNCLKVKLLLSLLNIKHTWLHIDILKGETRSASFLALNPNGKIPLVVFDDGRVLSESNAILGYFAEHTDFLPKDRFLKAKVYEWLFFEQYSHEPYIAVARFIQKYQNMPNDRLNEYYALHEKGYKALDVMEKQLEKTAFLTSQSPTIADIALYAYTHVANEGGFNLTAYPKIQRWLQRIKQLPGYVGMNTDSTSN